MEEGRILTEQQKFNDPKELKLVVQQVLHEVTKRIHQYLDGNLALNFPERLQTLESEIDGKDTSDWADCDYTEQEGNWRDHIADFAEH
eukprot:2910192-Rhodomonas_salina.3